MVGPEIAGTKVNLRPLRDDDLARRTEWLNDLEVVKLFTGSALERVYTSVDAERWRLSLEADLAAAVWAIETGQSLHIGDVDLHDINRSERSAKLTILIGDKAFWNKGYGADAVKALLGYAFTEMDLAKVILKVYDFNERAIRCYEKCGFIRTGLNFSGFSPGPGEVYMIATKDHFMATGSDAGTIRA